MEDELKERFGKGPELSKIFRSAGKNGEIEKVFMDHSAKPVRGYPTGELYRPLTEADGAPADDEEDVIIVRPEDFTPRRFRRISPIDNDCFFPKPADKS